MSHFSVLVVTSVKPSSAVLTEVLAPYHEFESTGESNKYVIDVDITDEVRAEYEDSTEAMMRSADGELVGRYDDRFYRDPTPEESEQIGTFGGTGTTGGLSYSSRDWGDGEGYRPKIHDVPTGWTAVDVPTKETKTFAAHIEDYHGYKSASLDNLDINDEHKYGYGLLDANGEVTKVIKRTNPGKKWDWWSVGGRFTGILTPTYEPTEDPANMETCILCGGTGKRMDSIALKLRETQPNYGCNGCNDTGKAVKFPSHWLNVGNQARKGEIDFFAIREAKAAEAGARYDKMHAIIAGRPIPKWEAVLKLTAENHAKARDAYWNDPVIKDLHAANPRIWFERDEIEALDCPRETYLDRARQSAVATFAVLKDGQWYERGSMGWWGCVSDEKDRDEWCREFSKLVDDLPDDTYLTVIDCHI